jgi:hypothetical protein
MIVTSPLVRLIHNYLELKAGGRAMACKQCDSDSQSTFNGEVAIHYPGLKGLDKPIVWVFPKLAVCLRCGLTEFTVPEEKTRRLKEESEQSPAA